MNAIRRAVACTALALLGTSAVHATAPTLFSSPANESPVRGDPDDLLIIPGNGFAATDRVVYQSLSDTTQPLTHPTTVPTSSTATSGTIQMVSSSSDVLTIRLPTVMQVDQSYALWVVNASNEWSAGIKINDARPLWISPDNAYVSSTSPALPRSIKVGGTKSATCARGSN